AQLSSVYMMALSVLIIRSGCFEFNKMFSWMGYSTDENSTEKLDENLSFDDKIAYLANLSGQFRLGCEIGEETFNILDESIYSIDEDSESG
ncbi:MAG: hypothetical protein MHPSP_004441, partial [Paramarteilia canceri]